MLRHARRLIVFVVGTTVLLAGLVLLVTSGPAFVVIPIGLAILSLEFAWARGLLRRAKAGLADTLGKKTEIEESNSGTSEKSR